MTISMDQVHIGYDALCRLLAQRIGYAVSRDVIYRLRRQYAERLTPPIDLPGHLLGWDDGHVDSFEQILREEDRCRR